MTTPSKASQRMIPAAPMPEPKRISDRQIEALHAIAEAGQAIAAALRETGRAGEGQDVTETGLGATWSISGDSRTPGEVQWRRADGTTGKYAGPVEELGYGIPRRDTGPGIRRALFDLAFGYVSGFPVRDILAYVFPGSFREAPVLEAMAERVTNDTEGA